jgi:hypothetical protein
MDTDARAAIYARYVEEAAAGYRCKPTDMKAKLAATRRLAFELYQARLIDGRDPDPSILKWFLEEEAKHAPPPEPYQLDITLVRRSHEVCPQCREPQPFTCIHCGFEETVEDFARRTAPAPSDPSGQPEKPASGAAGTSVGPSEPAKPPPFSRPVVAPGLVPEPQADSMSPLSVGHGAATNNWSNSWMIGGGTSYGPFSDPHPYLNRNGKGRY